jgi:hypothetical protein
MNSSTNISPDNAQNILMIIDCFGHIIDKTSVHLFSTAMIAGPCCSNNMCILAGSIICIQASLIVGTRIRVVLSIGAALPGVQGRRFKDNQ